MTGYGVLRGWITVPDGSNPNYRLGPTLMRVRSSYQGMGTDKACFDFTSGETEDYVINVLEADPVVLPCIPGNFIGKAGGYDITHVQLIGSGLDKQSSNTTDQENAFGNYYTRRPATGTSTGTVKRGTTYALRVSASDDNADLAVWVDWDHDSIFDISENIQVTGYGVLRGWITVPDGSNPNYRLGPTLMRVRSSYQGMGTDKACFDFTSGETEDYVINVLEADPVALPCTTGTSGNFIGTAGGYNVTLVQLGSGSDAVNKPSTQQEDAFGSNYILYLPGPTTTGKYLRDTSYTLHVTSSDDNADLGVWIDWNHNLVCEINENVALTTYGPITRQVRIPPTAEVGLTLIRVRSSYQGMSTSAGCGFFTSGETEDYYINILGQPGCNTGQASFATSGSLCAGQAGTVSPSFSPGASAGTFGAIPAGLAINVQTGIINLATSAPGVYDIFNYVAAAGTCPADTFTYHRLEVFAVPAAPSIRQSNTVPDTLFASSTTGNQWYVNGNAITSATGPYYIVSSASQNGAYAVKTTQHGCESALSAVTVVTLTDVLPTISTCALSVYPNPSTGQVNVRLAGATTDGLVQAYDAQGREVLTAKAAAADLQSGFALPGILSPGLYLIRFGMASVKVIVR